MTAKSRRLISTPEMGYATDFLSVFVRPDYSVSHRPLAKNWGQFSRMQQIAVLVFVTVLYPASWPVC